MIDSRLQVATAFTCVLLQQTIAGRLHDEKVQETLIRTAVKLTDALIAAVERTDYEAKGTLDYVKNLRPRGNTRARKRGYRSGSGAGDAGPSLGVGSGR